MTFSVQCTHTWMIPSFVLISLYLIPRRWHGSGVTINRSLMILIILVHRVIWNYTILHYSVIRNITWMYPVWFSAREQNQICSDVFYLINNTHFMFCSTKEITESRSSELSVRLLSAWCLFGVGDRELKPLSLPYFSLFT